MIYTAMKRRNQNLSNDTKHLYRNVRRRKLYTAELAAFSIFWHFHIIWRHIAANKRFSLTSSSCYTALNVTMKVNEIERVQPYLSIDTKHSYPLTRTKKNVGHKSSLFFSGCRQSFPKYLRILAKFAFFSHYVPALPPTPPNQCWNDI